MISRLSGLASSSAGPAAPAAGSRTGRAPCAGRAAPARAAARRGPSSPTRPADGGEQDGVGAAAGGERLVGQRRPVGVDRGAAERVLLVVEVVGDGGEDLQGGVEDLGADPVAGERDDVGIAGAYVELGAAHDAELERAARQLGALLVLRQRLDRERLEQRAQVGLHRAGADHERLGDLPRRGRRGEGRGRERAADLDQHAALGGRQPRRCPRRRAASGPTRPPARDRRSACARPARRRRRAAAGGRSGARR